MLNFSFSRKRNEEYYGFNFRLSQGLFSVYHPIGVRMTKGKGRIKEFLLLTEVVISSLLADRKEASGLSFKMNEQSLNNKHKLKKWSNTAFWNVFAMIKSITRPFTNDEVLMVC